MAGLQRRRASVKQTHSNLSCSSPSTTILVPQGTSRAYTAQSTSAASTGCGDARKPVSSCSSRTAHAVTSSPGLRDPLGGVHAQSPSRAGPPSCDRCSSRYRQPSGARLATTTVAPCGRSRLTGSPSQVVNSRAPPKSVTSPFSGGATLEASPAGCPVSTLTGRAARAAPISGGRLGGYDWPAVRRASSLTPCAARLRPGWHC